MNAGERQEGIQAQQPTPSQQQQQRQQQLHQQQHQQQHQHQLQNKQHYQQQQHQQQQQQQQRQQQSILQHKAHQRPQQQHPQQHYQQQNLNLMQQAYRPPQSQHATTNQHNQLPRPNTHPQRPDGLRPAQTQHIPPRPSVLQQQQQQQPAAHQHLPTQFRPIQLLQRPPPKSAQQPRPYSGPPSLPRLQAHRPQQQTAPQMLPQVSTGMQQLSRPTTQQQHPGIQRSTLSSLGMAGTATPPRASTSAPSARAGDTTAASRKAKKRKVESAPPPQKLPPVPVERMADSELLTKLQELDDQVKKCIAEQKLELRYAMKSNEYVPKKLRLYIQSEHLHQQHSPSHGQGDPPCWILKIWGKLMDATTEPVPKLPNKQQATPMTSLVKRMQLCFSGDVKEAHGPKEILWEKEKHKGEHRESFTFRRQGEGEVSVSISLELDSCPQLWIVSDPLKGVTGIKHGTRAEVLTALWTHIKVHNLKGLDGDVKCEHGLQTVFKEQSVPFSSLAEKIDEHLSLADPYTITYTFTPSQAPSGERVCYDLSLRVPVNPADQQSIPSVNKLGSDQEADALQLHINALVGAAKEHARRRSLLLEFSSSPVDFINGLIASQTRDLRAPQRPGAEVVAMRKSEFFGGKWVEDAVLRYLHRRLAAGA